MFDIIQELFNFDFAGFEGFLFLPLMGGLTGRSARRKKKRAKARQALMVRIRQADYDMISRVQRGLKIRRLENADMYRQATRMDGTTFTTLDYSETPRFTDIDTE